MLESGSWGHSVLQTPALVFLCIHRRSICPSRYLLLNHWAEFNQTCYITSPRGKGVQEQLYFSVHLPICPSRYLLLNHWPKFNQTCYITFPHGWDCESNIIFQCVCASVICPPVCHAISSKTTGQNSTQLATSLPLMMRVCESNIFFHTSVVHPSVCQAISS